MNETIAEKIYRQLKHDIDNMIIESNEFLIEKDIAKQYGVSKAPVREAIHRICQEGLLISYPRKGYSVVNISRKEISEIQKLRLLNESYAIDLLIENAELRQKETLLNIAEKKFTIDNNIEFHMTMAHMTDNRFLARTISTLIGTVSRSLNMINQYEEDKNYHEEIAKAIIMGDSVQAKSFLEKDLTDY